MNYKLKLILASNAVQVFAATLLIPVFAIFSKEIGGGIELVGVLFAISFFVTAVGNLVMIQVKDAKLRNVSLYKVGLLVKIIAWVLLAFNQSILTLIIAQIILGVATAIGSPAFSSLVSEHLDKRRHISDWAKWDFLQNSVTALSSVLSGFLVVHYGFKALFIIMASVTAASFLLALSITKKSSKNY